MRFSLCAAEYCFQQNALLESYFGAGNTIPILRGSGLNQPFLLGFARKVAAGRWVHIFPEGGVFQNDDIGSFRTPAAAAVNGKLKWGVAKLIAHAPIRPIVIPYIHLGMEKVIPLNPVDRNVEKWFPTPGNSIEVSFGKEIKFDDLLIEHEKVHGTLWTYSSSSHKELSQNYENIGLDNWISKPSDCLLYHKITCRIESELSGLQKAAISKRQKKENSGSLVDKQILSN